MSGHIFISGGGDIKDTTKLDSKFFELLKNNSRILYIPVAMESDSIGYEACFDWFSTLVSEYDNHSEVDFTMILERDDIPELDNFDAVYIGGGNTYTLLKYVYEKQLDKKIPSYLNSGGVVYGGSAGAIILGKDIRTVENENKKNLVHHTGLNLYKDYSFICHYEEKLDPQIYKVMEKIKSPVIALPEDSGLILCGEDIEIIGNAVVFRGDSKQLLDQSF